MEGKALQSPIIGKTRRRKAAGFGSDVGRGVVAGMAGTVALNITTYLDMLLRGRPASQVPSEVAGKLSAKAGIELDGEEAKNRQSALGALLGNLNGLGLGIFYGIVRPHLSELSRLPTGLILGAAAMAGSDVPAVALGVTDPRTWGASGWLSDVVPHAVYGLVVATTFDAISPGRSNP